MRPLKRGGTCHSWRDTIKKGLKMPSLGQTFAAFHVFVIAFARLFQFSRLLQEAMGPEDLKF